MNRFVRALGGGGVPASGYHAHSLLLELLAALAEPQLCWCCRTDHTNALYLSASGLGKRRGMSCALRDHCVLFSKQ